MTFHEIISIQLSHFSADGGSMTMNRYILSHNRSQRSRKWFAILPWAVLFVLGSAAADGKWLGTGKPSAFLWKWYDQGAAVHRLFLLPCRDMEPDLEPLLLDLVMGGTIILHLSMSPPASTPLCMPDIFSLL